MINTILTIILLILVTVLLFNKERFDTKDCNFIPRGINKTKCLEHCLNPEFKSFYETKDDSNNCTIDNCIDICNDCEDDQLCHWVNPYEKKKEIIPSTSELVLSGKVEENKLVLSWEWKEAFKVFSDFKNNYVINFKEVNTNITNVSILETNNKTYSFVLDNSSTALPLLKKNTEYIFVIYSTNKPGKNGTSNLINIKT